MSVDPARIVLAGVASGVGKTTIATGLMAALRARGFCVQGYKVGPDYIDPTYHQVATGRPSYNLDTWLSTPTMVRQRFDASMRSADIGIIEGVMGLFDGRKHTPDTASTAEIARLLTAPVLLIVDVSRMGQSVAAVVSGFQKLDPNVHIMGVIFNKVASADHEGTLRQAIAHWTDLPVLGAIRRDASLVLPERHLGLLPAQETTIEMHVLGSIIERSLNVDGIVQLAQRAASLPALPTDLDQSESPLAALMPTLKKRKPIRIGIALDRAFAFYYPETLDAFAYLGVECLPFSPLEDESIPDAVDLLYFGGGFPEVFAPQLATNQAMLASVRRAIQRGVFIYAECGGYMYLGKSCIDAAGIASALVGVLPYTFRMGTQRAQLGYREMVTARDTLLAPAGTALRGHEFHWSQITDPLVEAHAAYLLPGVDQSQMAEGYADQTILASYIHVPLAANPQALRRLMLLCLSTDG